MIEDDEDEEVDEGEEDFESTDEENEKISITGERQPSGEKQSTTAFERARHASQIDNDLVPEIHSLHRYLKHYIISSKAENVPGSKKITFCEYQVCF